MDGSGWKCVLYVVPPVWSALREWKVIKRGFILKLDDSFRLEGSEDWVFWVNKPKPRGLLENNHNHGFKSIHTGHQGHWCYFMTWDIIGDWTDIRPTYLAILWSWSSPRLREEKAYLAWPTSYSYTAYRAETGPMALKDRREEMHRDSLWTISEY